MPIDTAKLFTNGRSQAVRLPREFRFEGDEVFIRRDGNEVILSPRPNSWENFFDSGNATTDDCFLNRDDPPPQHRENL